MCTRADHHEKSDGKNLILVSQANSWVGGGSPAPIRTSFCPKLKYWEA